MKPLIFCLEDFEMNRFVLETNLKTLLGDTVDIRYFRSMRKFLACNESCDLLISDLHLGDSNADNTGRFLLEYCKHTRVIVQSSDPVVPEELEKLGKGRILAVEKAGQGERFKKALDVFMAEIQANSGLTVHRAA